MCRNSIQGFVLLLLIAYTVPETTIAAMAPATGTSMRMSSPAQRFLVPQKPRRRISKKCATLLKSRKSTSA